MSIRVTLAAVVALHGIPILAQGQTPTMPDRKPAAAAFITQLAQGNFAGAAATMDSTMHRALPAEKLKATWEALIAQAGTFRAQRSSASTQAGPYQIVAVTCEFARASVDVRVTFGRTGLVTGLFFVPTPGPWTPPSYVNPASFHAESVTVGAGALALPGTLTLPNGAGPFPALVLVHGSGPNDRDESVGGVKVFRDLAEGLSSRGIAVLRYEKRTREHPATFTGRFTVDDETVDDAVAAAGLLRARRDIDPARVAVLGHSLGGMMAPRIAQRDARLAGVVILAGTTRRLERVMLEQTAYLSSLPENTTPAAQAQIAMLREGAARVERLTLADSASATPIIGAPASYWLDLQQYHPGEVARTLTRPLLILQGERDYQVTMADFAGWQQALAGQPNVTFRSYPGLNHLFVTGVGPSKPSEYAASAHVAAVVVDDIARWLKGVPPL